MKHTLGPWAAQFDADDASDSPWGIRGGNGFWVACVFDSASKPHGSQSEANARLIAAAPEMYEALKELCAAQSFMNACAIQQNEEVRIHAVDRLIRAQERADAILAKAEGA